ncbi:Uncharacterized protein, UPF0303 family [Sphingomonas sp. YR710]|jgi:uncharacterized protein (UPF0303 family)|uniref:heme-degrading domain-containing protein n=1 Tax=Sphingomonas sp. YR710 TaxID=1882773 RepID=UPI00088793D0|nr:heme-degrading domain-containing protein [Sphingomonas sp. YR710]SDD05064.1 Uncharacterized protein, UPF0303 family [Sphingomonas sp. YR710]
MVEQGEPTPEEIDRAEQALLLRRFDADDAWWLGCRLRDHAAARHAPVAIEIRRAGTRLFSVVMPGATQDNLAWVDRKIAIAMRFERSSYALNLMFRAGDGLFERFGLNRATYAPAGGAVPIRLIGTGVIGAAAISGLAQEEDHGIVIEALAALKAHQGEASA